MSLGDNSQCFPVKLNISYNLNIWFKQYFILSKLHIIYKYAILSNGLDSKLKKLIVSSPHLNISIDIHSLRYGKRSKMAQLFPFFV